MKPILVIKQKCRDGFPSMSDGLMQHPRYCKCKGTGQQEIKIYALRDFDCEDWVFEECPDCEGIGLGGHDCGEDTCPCINPEDNIDCITCDGKGNWMSHELCCSGNGYNIPKEYEPYEIKEVREITESEICEWMQVPRLKEQRWMPSFLTKLDLKEDDKVVVRR